MAFPPKFTNIQPLTPGRNATVFKAVNAFVGRDVFLKLYPIPPEDSLSALREPQLLCQLAHQNLVKIFGADVLSDGRMLLEMELVTEGSFQDVIETEATRTVQWPSVHESLRLILEAAAGLSHLHSNGYVHRDIKPANLVIRKTGTRRQGVVTDLGLASKLDQSGRAFASQHARLYRPPEVWEGKGYSASSDIYQLGIVLFQLLGGSLDYSLSNLSDADLKARVLTGNVIDLDSVGPHVEERLRRLIRKCVCSETGRISSIADLVVGLNDVRVNHIDWSYSLRPGGFDLERIDSKGARHQISVEVTGGKHVVLRRKQTAGGKFRAYGPSAMFEHKDIGRCQRFRKFIVS
ncbi:MAG: serine/threonine-protein kinase [Chthoniobacteraceae bacterium]